MADMKITLDVVPDKFKECLDTSYKGHLDYEEGIKEALGFCKFLNNTVVINIDFDNILFHGDKIADAIEDYKNLYDDSLTFSVTSSSFKVWDINYPELINLLHELFNEYDNLCDEYDHAFIMEYLEQNKELPERDLYVVSLGETNREAQLENFGVYLWENYLDGQSNIEDMAELGELSEYITINYVALAHDFIGEWEETATYAYRSL